MRSLRPFPKRRRCGGASKRRSATRSATISLDPRAGVEHARQERVVTATIGRGPVDPQDPGTSSGRVQLCLGLEIAFQQPHGGGETSVIEPVRRMDEMRWLKPSLVAQVRFVEWTTDAHLRHAAFLGLRSDKKAGEVRREA